MKTLIDNIAQLVAVPPGPVVGEAFSHPPIIENAAVLLDCETIAWFGPRADAPITRIDHTIDARGGTVVPGLVDCHTHVVFAGSREDEYVRRIGGATYLEILQAGGGIRSTVRAVRQASVDELVEQSRPRLKRMLAWGTTTVEIKTGYGLTPDDEIKMLLAVRRLAEELPIELVPTYLAAHAVPPEYDSRPDDYLQLMTDPLLLQRIRGEHLAEFADVFCERGAFNLEQSYRFLTACQQAGLRPKIHAEQITNSGAAKMAAALGAVSADHLECIDDATIAALKDSLRQHQHDDPIAAPKDSLRRGRLAGTATIPVLLPGCSFFLGTAPAPARKLIDAGLPVALATDCNPGSCPIESLPLIMSIAASLLKMTPLESLVACTANAAAALARAGRLGAITQGYQADLLILDIPNISRLAYQVGMNPVRTVLKRGRVVSDAEIASAN